MEEEYRAYINKVRQVLNSHKMNIEAFRDVKKATNLSGLYKNLDEILIGLEEKSVTEMSEEEKKNHIETAALMARVSGNMALFKNTISLIEDIEDKSKCFKASYLNYQKNLFDFLDKAAIGKEVEIDIDIRQQAVVVLKELIAYRELLDDEYVVQNDFHRENLFRRYKTIINDQIYQKKMKGVRKFYTGYSSAQLLKNLFKYYKMIELLEILENQNNNNNENKIQYLKDKIMEMKENELDENEHFFPQAYSAEYLLSDDFLQEFGTNLHDIKVKTAFTIMFFNAIAAYNKTTKGENKCLQKNFENITSPTEPYQYIPSPMDLYDDCRIELIKCPYLTWLRIRDEREDPVKTKMETLKKIYSKLNEFDEELIPSHIT